MKGFTLKLPANAPPDHGVDGSEVTNDHGIEPVAVASLDFTRFFHLLHFISHQGRQLKLSSYVDATFQRDYEHPGIKSLRAATRDERALHATLA